MVWVFALFLGLVQGITEFLPVSSSGHLSIFQNFFGMQELEGDYLLLDVLLHLGTLVSVCLVYADDIAGMFTEFFRWISDLIHHRKSVKVPPARRLLVLVIAGTLPLVFFIPFIDVVESLTKQPLFIGIALLATGALLWLADHIPKGNKDEKTARVTDVLFIGFMQGVATIPGLSRSGLTISTGLFRRFDRKFAVRYSFLLSLPAVVGAGIVQVSKAAKAGSLFQENLPPFLAGMVMAAVAGFFAIRWLRRLADKGRFGIFAYYCLIAGLITILLAWLKVGYV